MWSCIAGYIIFILYETLFSRAGKDMFQYDFHPFWSYVAIMDGSEKLMRQNCLNVALFIPLGVLLWCVIRSEKWWMALVFGAALSICIEAMQLLMKRGFCEFDDVFHNTLGTLLGYWLAVAVAAIVKPLFADEKIDAKNVVDE